jgi:hypothetical protein
MQDSQWQVAKKAFYLRNFRVVRFIKEQMNLKLIQICV